MSTAEASLVRPHLRKFCFERGAVVADIGSTTSRIYFPVSGCLNVFIPTQDGQAVRIGMVGRDGVLGVNHGAYSTARVIAQLPCVLLGIAASQFREIVEAKPALRRIAAISMETQLEQARSTAVCNLLHSAEQRFCRVLLETSDCISNDEVALTHEDLSELVGVQRSFVTAMASSLRKQGAIEYARGTIKLSNKKMLKNLACECYERSKRAVSEIS